MLVGPGSGSSISENPCRRLCRSWTCRSVSPLLAVGGSVSPLSQRMMSSSSISGSISLAVKALSFKLTHLHKL